MSTPLQRWIERARGAQGGPALRIEPLLGPRFAAPTTPGAALQEADAEIESSPGARIAAPTTSGIALQEADTEDVAATHRPAKKTRTAPANGTAPTPDGRQVRPGGRRDAAVPPLHDAPFAISSNLASPRDHSHGERPAPSLLEDDVDETMHEGRVGANTRRVGARTSPAHTDPTHGDDKGPAAAAPQTPLALSQDDAPVRITISIGHVEVRNAPAPAPAAPRRPAFRPSVSLDAFLQRGKGERR